MERYKEDFASKLKGFDLETLENSRYSIYALSKDMELIYFNPAWIRFAQENDVDRDVLNKFSLGTAIPKVLKGQEVRDFYIQNYKNVLATGKVWRHEYECSSIDEFRYFHQGVYPLKDGEGIIVINTLLVNVPADLINRKAYEAIEKQYLQPTGLITQCTNCRYTQRADQPEIWDWVPSWVEKMPDNISHSICPTCFDYHWKYL